MATAPGPRQDDTVPPVRRVVWGVNAAAAALGGLAGVFVWPVWTHNLIGGQILSGVVPYPSGSLMAAAYGTPYSILAQAAAVLLWLGVDEWTVALVFSGLQGAVSCAALAMFTLAFSRSAVAGLLAPAMMLRFSETLPMWPSENLAVFHGHLYPNIFPVSGGLFGAIGMYWGLLALAFLALERKRTAAAMLGVMPAMHVGLALPFIIGTAGVAATQRGRDREWWAGMLAPFLSGLAVFVLTAIWHSADLPAAVPATDARSPEPLLRAFLDLWNDHTRLLRPGEWPGFVESELYTLVVGVSCFTYLRSLILRGARTATGIVLVITALGLAGTLLVNLAPDLTPWQLRVALVPRWLNLSAWFFVLASFGLLGRLAFERRNTAASVVLGVVCVLVWSRLSKTITIAGTASYLEMLPQGRVPALLSGAPFPLILVLSACWLTARCRSGSTGVSGTWADSRWRRLAIVAMLATVCALPFRNARWNLQAESGSCSEVIARAREGSGTLLLGDQMWDVGWVQVRTRRPVLVEPLDLNILPFTPGALPRAAEILEKVYAAPIEKGPPSRLDRDWPSYDHGRWQGIAREFGVTEVFGESGMIATLPVVADDGRCALYRLPTADTR